MSGNAGTITALAIDPALKQRCPRLRVACVQGSVTVSKSSAELVGLLQARASALAASADSASHPEIAATRDAYKKLGKDPSRYRGSAEALIRRIAAGKGLYFINNLVDINNLVSLESFLPIGSYDLSKIEGSILFRVGNAGESYKGIGKDMINTADLPVFSDTRGAFGSPTSDSERAMITGNTTRFAIVIISFSGTPDLPRFALRAQELLRTHSSGCELSYSIVE